MPLGLRAINGALPGADVRDSYLPTVETPRPREPFDRGQPRTPFARSSREFVVIGDSMAGIRIDPLQLSRLTGTQRRRAVPAGQPGRVLVSRLKNLVADNELKNVRGAIFFFRDDQLTTQVQVAPGSLDRVARDREPELDRIAGGRPARRVLGRASRGARRVSIRSHALVARAAADHCAGAPWPASTWSCSHAVNTDVFALDKLRKFEAADLPRRTDAALDFAAQRRAVAAAGDHPAGRRANIRLAFIRVQRRPTAGRAAAAIGRR